MAIESKNALPIGHTIKDYRIESILGIGGFGITYQGVHQTLKAKVAIKEYLPQEFALRDGKTSVSPKSNKEQELFQWGLDSFLREARFIAQLNHPSIVRVRDFFAENSTAYMVMDFEEGQTLTELIDQQGGKLDLELLKSIIIPITDGLKVAHKANIIHRDIKPDNIYVRSSGSPMLIDFGAARTATSEKSKSLTVVLSEGYAPFEQYSERAALGPSTDIYALGAVIYRALTGIKSPSATDRVHSQIRGENEPMQSAVELISNENVARLIDQMLAIEEQNRPDLTMVQKALLATGVKVSKENIAKKDKAHKEKIAKEKQLAEQEQQLKNEQEAKAKRLSERLKDEQAQQLKQEHEVIAKRLVERKIFRRRKLYKVVALVIVSVLAFNYYQQEYRWIASDKGTVKDSKTGLIWMRCSIGQNWNGTTCTGTATKHNWEKAKKIGRDKTFAGFSDWRLPAKNELQTLICQDCGKPTINSNAFPNTRGDWYWSSSPYAIIVIERG